MLSLTEPYEREKERETLKGKTHLHVGLATGVAVAAFQQGSLFTISMSVVAAGIASLLPDIDEDHSKINNWMFQYITKKHRSFALAVMGVLVIIAYFYFHLPFWTLLSGIFAAGVAYAPHRSVTHSLIGVAYVTWVMYLAAPFYLLPVIAGYVSHLVTDGMTVAGVPLLWPWKERMGLKAIGIEIRTGRKFDQVLGWISLCVACIGYFFLIGQHFIQ